nr:MAG TPA: DNA pilot protein VP2 [Microviridae sp.]
MPAAPFVAQMAQALGANAASSAGTSAGAGLADALFGGISARRNWKYKQKEMALQQQYALEQMSKSAEFQLAHDKQMFDYQNAYNDPSAVLERNLAAGLNPAAVLGQSGVGVSATIPTSSGGAPSGHGPVASGSGGGLAALAGDPSAYADIQLKDAQQERERSAASLNDAEADWYRSQTLDKDLRERLMKAQAGLAEAGITESTSRANLNTAITLSYSIDNELKDATFGYNLEMVKADLGKAKEEYYQLKARTGYIDDQIEAELQLLTARALYLKSSSSNQDQLARVNELTADDLENWFDVNWNTEVEVPIVNEKGNVERTIKMTGKEIRKEYMKLNLQDFQYDMYTNRWALRSEKNRFGYSLVNTAVSGAISAAGGVAGAKVLSSAPPVQRYEDVLEDYTPNSSSLGGGWSKRTTTTSRQWRHQ